jgi:hypothetical protein
VLLLLGGWWLLAAFAAHSLFIHRVNRTGVLANGVKVLGVHGPSILPPF